MLHPLGAMVLLQGVISTPACRVASATLARSTAPSMLLLPVAHTTRQYLATAVCSGGLALCSQGALVLAFRRSNNRILQRSAGFTAHHIIALLFMIVATAVGFAGWFSPSAATASAAARVLVADGTARWLSAMLLGELLLWDFPCSLFIPKLQVPVIIGHHVGLLATAALACVAPLYWGTFYLGWAELSNIPLQLIDTLEHAQGVAAEVDAPAATCVARCDLALLLRLLPARPRHRLHRRHGARPVPRHPIRAAHRWRAAGPPPRLPGPRIRLQRADALLVRRSGGQGAGHRHVGFGRLVW